MTELKASDPCPCHSGKVYGDCCGPIIGGDQKGSTAEALIRAPHTAYAIYDVDFLLASSRHPLRAAFAPRRRPQVGPQLRLDRHGGPRCSGRRHR